MDQFSEKEIWTLFKSLPNILKKTILSEETADIINRICERYKISDEKKSIVATLVGRVLLGILPPQELASHLETELSLTPNTAKKVSQEITRFIFFPVKDLLSVLYSEIQFAPGGRILPKKEEAPESPSVSEQSPPPTKTPQTDIYREPIE